MINIAIDGPAGAGKSTIAKMVAKKLGITHIETGAMYRAIALACLQKNVPIDDEQAVSEVCEHSKVRVTFYNQSQQVYLNNKQVDDLLRTELISKSTSVISKYAAVRDKMLKIQQALAQNNSCVMDGRDIGTRVLPNADVKIFLTANSTVRARRRFSELKAKNQPCNFMKIKAEIEERDYRDSHRKISPLTQAQDAVYLDSSHMTQREVVYRILELCQF
jgi:cytidylate kinase